MNTEFAKLVNHDHDYDMADDEIDIPYPTDKTPDAWMSQDSLNTTYERSLRNLLDLLLQRRITPEEFDRRYRSVYIHYYNGTQHLLNEQIQRKKEEDALSEYNSDVNAQIATYETLIERGKEELARREAAKRADRLRELMDEYAKISSQLSSQGGVPRQDIPGQGSRH